MVGNTTPTTLDIGWAAGSEARDGFIVYRSSNDGETYSPVKTLNDPDVRNWSDTGPLVVGKKYWYRVRAFTGTIVSASVKKAFGIPVLPIDAPTNLMAQGIGPGQISLTWTPSADPRVTAYRVYRSQTPNFLPSAANLVTTTDAATSLITDSGLTTGQTYYYTVVAVGADNVTSVPSVEVSAVAETDASNRFQASFKFGVDNAAVMPGYTADIGNGYREGSSGYSYGWINASGAPKRAGAASDRDQVDPSLTDSAINTYGENGAVSWEVAVPNGTYYVKLVAGSPDVSFGRYEYGIENKSTFLDGSATSAAKWITATDTVTVYDGRLTISNVGDPDNHFLAYVEITDAAGKLRNAVDAPLNVVATAAASNKIDVRWTDASDNETGFRIDRATGPNGTWMQVGTVAANAAVFTNTDTFAAGTDYRYRVVAVKDGLLGRTASNAITTPGTTVQTPYNPSRTPWATGTVIQAEDFDAGGDQVSYDDVINGNAGGYYRNTNVDIGYNIPSDRYFVGWTSKTEWVEYTINVPTAGRYQLAVSSACEGLGGTFEISANGVDQHTSFSIPDTGSFTQYQQALSGTINLA
ncbi:MAG: hypothetical protein JWM57_250, partial [Phycisphaerales bacterium]|nr:hypothetical protein [Phycisphaerales bacterium]